MSYYLCITVIPGGKKKFDVANSEEELKNTTVLQLRRKIASEYKDCYEFGCRLIYEMQPLEDHYTLGHYGITQGSTLICVFPLPGGGGPLPEGEDGGIHRTESTERLRLSM